MDFILKGLHNLEPDSANTLAKGGLRIRISEPGSANTEARVGIIWE